MAKKGPSPRLSPAQMVQPDVDANKVEISHSKGSGDLNEAYRYVITDLRRIAIIAVIMLIVMVVLAVVLI
jgi:hypothetical protein